MFYTFFRYRRLGSRYYLMFIPLYRIPPFGRAWVGYLFYIIIMPHHITDALCQEVWHDRKAYEAYYVQRSIAKRVGVEYAQLIYHVIMAQREEP